MAPQLPARHRQLDSAAGHDPAVRALSQPQQERREAHYETRLAGDFDRIEPLALRLERDGRIAGGVREHLKRIGALLLIEHRMVGRAEIGDKPDLLWDHPALERLFALLEAEFEVRERLAAIERKLALVARTVRTLVDLLNAEHALRVEWYILALIAVDILLTLYGVWVR
jgi:uncharacterized Rmd1/YagE family protein